MKKKWLVLPSLCLLLMGCDTREDNVSAGLTGIDHLPDHMSVQNFSLNGTSGFQAGKGGREVCCVSLPRKWQPDLTAVVRWNVTNWRDCGWERFERRVPVERYDKVGHAWVHFMADGSVRVVSSDIGPGIYGPNADYPGPHDLIPQKHPWKVYGPQSTHCPPQDQPTVMERLQ
ncbi:DUF3304 domain-containing protein [Pseudomonas sp. R5(2019)]|uniref:DUF3304 domain-containing protein n=1 Tax=Pseudomonas sp. R5(2019) TaxID=2697566 RepID=UPI0014133CD4|nr:DUF3304 domain-containing protein [Pseudomonas sp. R5(2019)]NBA95431.1 DUF3304 domain-containing protein [Pseudomonas sp. R5(2019)]